LDIISINLFVGFFMTLCDFCSEKPDCEVLARINFEYVRSCDLFQREPGSDDDATEEERKMIRRSLGREKG
jgi:hypothetical protein